MSLTSWGGLSLSISWYFEFLLQHAYTQLYNFIATSYCTSSENFHFDLCLDHSPFVGASYAIYNCLSTTFSISSSFFLQILGSFQDTNKVHNCCIVYFVVQSMKYNHKLIWSLPSSLLALNNLFKAKRWISSFVP